MDRSGVQHNFVVSSIINTCGSNNNFTFDKNSTREAGSEGKACGNQGPTATGSLRDSTRVQNLAQCNKQEVNLACVKRNRLIDKCLSHDRFTKGQGFSGMGLTRRFCQGDAYWGHQGDATEVVPGKRRPRIVEPMKPERDDDIIRSVLSMMGVRNEYPGTCGTWAQGEELENTAEVGDKGEPLQLDRATLASSSLTGMPLPMLERDVESENESDIRIKRILKKLTKARGIIARQNEIIINLEKQLFNIAENFITTPRESEDDLGCIKTELKRAKKIMQAQCDQLDVHRSLIDMLKMKKRRLKLELQTLKLEKNASDESIEVLRNVIYQMQTEDTRSNSNFSRGDSDVLCLHDTFFKSIRTELFEKQQLVIDGVLCDHLSDALLHLETYKGKPLVVIVHTGKNDLATRTVDEMCAIVSDIHACVTNNGSKLIMCNVTPTYEKQELAQKVYLFNWAVSARLGAYDNVTICKGNGLTDQDALIEEYGDFDPTKSFSTFTQKTLKRHRPYTSKGKENVDEKFQDAYEKTSKAGLFRFN